MTESNDLSASTQEHEDIVLSVNDLRVGYKTYRGIAKVVDGISFYVRYGEKIGFVGESGCGKTTTMKTILRLHNPQQIEISSGTILVNGRDVLKMSDKEILQVRRRNISMVSQEPMAALNPFFTIGDQMTDIIKYSRQFPDKKKEDLLQLAEKSINDVMIPDGKRILNSYPHQLSGGMRQRICIAMALSTPRDLLIADEPGTALDVTIQDQIHRLLKDMVTQKKRSLIMITHSLGVARELVDRIYIMYAGNIVETAQTKALFAKPSHPYTEGLMRCVPRISGGGVSEGIYGYVPDYVNPSEGCRFAPRCQYRMPVCEQQKPPQFEIETGHFVACYKYAEGLHKGEEGVLANG